MPRRYDTNRYDGADFEEPAASRTSSIRIQKKTYNYTTPQDVEEDVYGDEYNPQTTRLVSDPNLSQRLRPAGMPARTTGSHPPATRKEPMQQVTDRRRPRPNTEDDKTVDTRRVAAQQPRQGRFNRRELIIMGVGAGITFLVAGGVAGTWMVNEVSHLKTVMTVGSYPAAVPLFLRCGHNDDAAKGQKPTELHAFLVGQDRDARIAVTEYPGGDVTKRYSWFSPTMAQFGYTGDLSAIRIELKPQEIAPKKYQIQVRTYLGSDDNEHDTLLVDVGDHFEPAKTSQP
jgi:hypothetical protein